MIKTRKRDNKRPNNGFGEETASVQADLGLKTVRESGPIECLGKTFPNDEARREYFLNELAKKLKDPVFRKIEGFPIGEDEDILALSDPPYYTACPNPWLADFVKNYGTPCKIKDKYHREPFAADVSEGKTHPIYSAHGYHTKVPHRAIMRYLLHYTRPGDVVLDGFCGTGMTGVACQLCDDQAEIQNLGYRVLENGDILNTEGVVVSKVGARHAVLNDLSPIATFIAHNYNTPFDVDGFVRAAADILAKAESSIGWMYKTNHKDGRSYRFDFVIWSEVFACPECAAEITFYDEALNQKTKDVRDFFPCPSCGVTLTKRRMERLFETTVDPANGQARKQVKFRPSEIHYRVNGRKFKKAPDANDLAILKKISTIAWPTAIPTNRFPIEQMYHGSRIKPKGFTHAHHFFFRRPAEALAFLWHSASEHANQRLVHALLFFIEQAVTSLNVQNRYGPKKYSQSNGALPLVYYIPSQIAEVTPWYVLSGKLKRIGKVFRALPSQRRASIIATGSTAEMLLADSSIDYIFTDPPFGSNIPYADLNLLTESWHRVFTNSIPEAIVDSFKNKALNEYHSLMLSCFTQYFRALKPGRWMTVEFSNSSASVWNTIQTALQEAGFVVANVSALDKRQLGYKAIVSPTAVKQDLVISAYKPNGGLEERFAKTAETKDGIWDFVRTHLNNLPIVKPRGGQLEPITERDPRILFDRTIAFYVRHGIPVPISSAEFQAELAEKFPERDGMYFLPDQAAEFDKVRMKMEGIGQLTIFVEDERSAANWLRNYLKNKPSKHQDIQPEFFEQLNQGWKKWETRPELHALLNQYFLCYSGEGDVPPQIHSYLSTNFKELRKLAASDAVLRSKARDRWYVPDPRKNSDVEQLREKHLLEEFWTYLPAGYEPAAKQKKAAMPTLPGIEKPMAKIPKGKRLAIVRTEAVRVGFNFCFAQNDYRTIIVVAEHIPEDVIHNDEQLQIIYDSAVTRTGVEPE